MKKKIMLVVAAMAMTTVYAQNFNQKGCKDCRSYLLKGGLVVNPNGDKLPLVEFEAVRGGRTSNVETGLILYSMVEKGSFIPGVDVTAGYHFSGDHAFLRVNAIGGLGGAAHWVISENETFRARQSQVQLRPELGAAVSAGFKFGRVGLQAEIAYRYQFGMETGKTQVYDMTVVDEFWTSNRLSATIGLSYNLCSAARFDGDKSMQVKASMGYGKQAIATVGFDWLKRPAFHWIYFHGVEFGRTFNGEVDTYSAVAELGIQYLLRGADSRLIPEFSVKAGLGEAAHVATAKAEAENGDVFIMKTFNVSQGLELGAYAGLNLNLGRFVVKAGYEFRHTFHSKSTFKGMEGSIEKVNSTFGYGKMGIAYTF